MPLHGSTPLTLTLTMTLFLITTAVPLPPPNTAPPLTQGTPEIPNSFAPLSPESDIDRLAHYKQLGLEPTQVPKTQPFDKVHPDARAFANGPAPVQNALMVGANGVARGAQAVGMAGSAAGAYGMGGGGVGEGEGLVGVAGVEGVAGSGGGMNGAGAMGAIPA